MATESVPRGADQLQEVLDSPEVLGLIAELEALRWTGRPGYPIRSMIGIALAKAIYAIPTWTRIVRLVAEHDGLQRVIGCAPSEWACYRFTRTLRKHSKALAACLDGVIGSLSEHLEGLGKDIAIDGSDLPAYANGQRYLSLDPPNSGVGSRGSV